MKSLVAEFGKKLLLVQESIFVKICLFNELQNVIIANVDVQVLVEDWLDLVETHQASLLAIEEGEHVKGLFFSSSTEEPLFGDKFDDLGEWEGIFVLMSSSDLILNFLAIHFSVGKVAENASEILSIDISTIIRIIEGEGILDFIFLNRLINTISSVSLLLVLAFLPLVFDTFFLSPFISYKIIVSKWITTKIIYIHHFSIQKLSMITFHEYHEYHEIWFFVDELWKAVMFFWWWRIFNLNLTWTITIAVLKPAVKLYLS